MTRTLCLFSSSTVFICIILGQQSRQLCSTIAETRFSYSRLFSWYSWAAWLFAGLFGFGSSNRDCAKRKRSLGTAKYTFPTHSLNYPCRAEQRCQSRCSTLHPCSWTALEAVAPSVTPAHTGDPAVTQQCPPVSLPGQFTPGKDSHSASIKVQLLYCLLGEGEKFPELFLSKHPNAILSLHAEFFYLYGC